jgi:hypothetical protein
MAKKTYNSNYIFTKGTSGNTAVTLPIRTQSEQVLLIIHVPSKTTLYSFNETTFSNVTFSNIQKTITVTGTTTNGSTAITFSSPNWTTLNYNGAGGVQQGWRITGTGMPSNGNTVDYTNGTNTIYLDSPATASGSVSLTFTDQNFVTQISNIPVDTSSYASTDRLLIICDSEPAPQVSFRDFLIDPVGKLRVSNPQSLIDTDFEYGPQATKWQTVQLINHMFSTYGRNSDTPLSSNIANIQGNGTSIVSVGTSSDHGLTSGTPIQVVGTSSQNANGTFLVATVPNTKQFFYVAQGSVTAGNIFQNGSIVYPGFFYTGSQIPLAGAIKTHGNTSATVVTSSEHGLSVNNTISVVNSSTQTSVDGAWTIATVPNSKSFTYTLNGTVSGGAYTTSSVYVRPQGIAYAKPYDGGILMTTNDTQPNASIIRQSRKYFRYQSGKGVQVSFAVAFNNPAQPNSNIACRAGVFDDQNGAYYEWDGATLWACRRSSIRQVTGTISVTNGSGIITGTGTAFSTEVAVDQYVVIKGVSYKVVAINSNTSLSVVPAYRNDGSYSTQTGISMSLTTDARIPQSGFNLNKGDGTDEGGFKVDINKILMYYIDYAWYGAGSLRFGVKDQNGEILYLHKFVHGNNKVEAYFRSGNLPIRYEVKNGSTAPATSPSLFHWGTSLIMDGGFNDDRGYTFSATGQLNTINQFSPYTVLNIRLAPTADNGIPGGYGVRDLTNHMQVWPLSVDISASDACQVQIVLNGVLSSSAPVWTNVGGNSLVQYDDQATLTTGGETVFQGIVGAPAPRQNAVNYSGFVTTGGFNFQTITYDLSKVKELNNSIFGGFNTYPDGPDTLSVLVTPLNNNVRVYARAVLRWQENQA